MIFESAQFLWCFFTFIAHYHLLSWIVTIIFRLKSTFSRYTLVDTFVQALEQLSQPEAFFSDWVSDTNEKLKQRKPDFVEIGL